MSNATIMKIQQHRILFLSFYLVQAAFGAPTTRIIAPVANLEESIAASVARRTTLAVAVNDVCCLLITRVPKQESSVLAVTSEKDDTGEDDAIEMEGLPVRRYSPLSPWISQLTRSSVLCMTGFAADVAHLTGVVEREVVNYQAVYEKPQPVHKTIRSLTHLLRRATHSPGEGGRPFGVGGMVVGRSNSGSDTWRIFTVDPSATWRAPGNHVAVIGRSASAVEKYLREGLQRSGGAQATPAKECLQVSIQSVLKALYDEDYLIDSESFECLLLLWNGKRCNVWVVDHNYVTQQCKICVTEVSDGKNS